jgi:hypothetical protein
MISITRSLTVNCANIGRTRECLDWLAARRLSHSQW